MQENKTQEEKIDYIYQTLKKQESRVLRATLFKWGFRLFILLYLIYFIKVGLPLMIDSMIPSIPEGMNTDTMKEALNKYLQR